jgi:hypothetical protein
MIKIASGIASILAMIIACHLSFAGEIFQWRDAAGHVHFTDDPAKVPWEYQDGASRQMKDYAPARKVASRHDKDVWKLHCAECHHPGEGRVGDLRGLAGYALHEASDRFMKLPEQMLPDLRKAIEGRTTDMKPMSLDDNKLLAISRHLIQEQIDSRSAR